MNDEVCSSTHCPRVLTSIVRRSGRQGRCFRWSTTTSRLVRRSGGSCCRTFVAALTVISSMLSSEWSADSCSSESWVWLLSSGKMRLSLYQLCCWSDSSLASRWFSKAWLVACGVSELIICSLMVRGVWTTELLRGCGDRRAVGTGLFAVKEPLLGSPVDRIREEEELSKSTHHSPAERS